MKETVEPWGILGALDREVALLREQMEITQTVTTLGTEFVFGRLHGQSVVVACCGVGKVNAAICATWMLLVAGCGCIINVGIAGAVGRGLRTLDVVASRELCFHDQDPVMLKYFPKRRFFEADAGLLERFRKACAEPGVVHGSVRVGRIATGDRFVADRATRDRIVADCAPDCVEMEGAAIAHAAFAAGKPFLVIRTMSDCADDDTESVYDDYAAADMARRMGKTEDADYFAQRAEYYKNLFDPTTRFMRPRNADGTWKSPFNPSDVGHAESSGGDYTEGNAWQYTWHVQHDVDGLIELFGGEQPFLDKLDSVFTTKLVTAQADVTGLIGQYAHGNEPSHHVAYLYTLAGRPERTQELIRQIFDTQYRNKPDGLCGNDDCGQMSAWYMFSAMGFYPVDPVSGEYVFGAPQLPKFTLHLPGNKTFTIIAEGLSESNKYISNITLNGKPHNRKSISHDEILKGGTLIYTMTSDPTEKTE